MIISLRQTMHKNEIYLEYNRLPTITKTLAKSLNESTCNYP